MSVRTMNDTEHPIDNVDEALARMHVNWGDYRTEAVLFRNRFDGPPYIDRQHFCGAYDSYSGAHRYFVTKEVSEQLFTEGLVVGTPHWGYTDDRECRLTEGARNRAFEQSKRFGGTY